MAYWLSFIFIGGKIEQLKRAGSIRNCTFKQEIKNFEQLLKEEINTTLQLNKMINREFVASEDKEFNAKRLKIMEKRKKLG
jgi:hypothetical protein